MSWDAGTITDAAPWAALSTKLKSLCTAHAGSWSFIENVPAGTGAGQSGSASFSVDVFKSDGTTNGPGIDFYFFLFIPTTDGAVSSSYGAAESFDATAGEKKVKRQCPTLSSTGITPTGAGYWRIDTYGTFNAVTGGISKSGATLNTSGFSYWMKMTDDLIHIALRIGTTEECMHVSILDSITAVSDPMPLVCGKGSQSSASAAPGTTFSFSRLPSVVTALQNQSGFSARTFGWPRPPVASLYTNATNSNDLWQNNGIYAGRIGMEHFLANTYAYLVGGVRGLVPADILCFPTGGTVALGDTMTIDGNADWTVIATNNVGGSGFGADCWVTRAI